jgi:hypothetical protein
MGSTQPLAELAASALSWRQEIFVFTTWRLNTELNLHHHHHHQQHRHNHRRLCCHRIHNEMSPAHKKTSALEHSFTNLQQTTGGTE